MMKRFIYQWDGPGGMECGYWEDEDKIYLLLREFFFFMDATEESEDGSSFKPNRISSSRALDGNRLDQLMTEMKAKLLKHDEEFENV